MTISAGMSTMDIAVPSLVANKIRIRLKRVSDGTRFSLDMSADGVDAVDLGNRGAVPLRHAVVSGR
ncbi:MAG: hypothetical protein ACKODB_05605 [Betaproteobacteria bacterium]